MERLSTGVNGASGTAVTMAAPLAGGLYRSAGIVLVRITIKGVCPCHS